MKGIGFKIIKALHKKGLFGLINPYGELDKKINNAIRNKIISKINKSTDEEIFIFLISYFKIYKINYGHHEKKTRKLKAKPENKENIKKRQKAFIERKKSTGAKKMQIYISEEAYNKLKNLKESENSTYSELMQNLILDHKWIFKKVLVVLFCFQLNI